MPRPGRVIVIGGTVMDATFHTKDIPPRGTSTEAYAFGRAPGGKGLWQAVWRRGWVLMSHWLRQ